MLRKIQRRAYLALQAEARKGIRRILLCAQTGFGKTVLLAFIVASHLSRGGRAIIFVHRRELVGQTVRKLRDQGVERVGVIAAGEPEDPEAPVQVAMVQTMLARRSFPAASLVILDEAHHYVADEWGTVAEHYKDAIVLGFTATPERADGTPLGDIFETMVVAAKFGELIELGFLKPIDVIAPERKTRALCTDPFDAYQAHGGGRKAVLFASSVKEAKAIAERFTAGGVPAACVDGDTPAAERDDILAAFERGELRVVTNVYCLTEGWDCPSVEVVILARSCGSAATYLQIVGRVLRPSPETGKASARLIDLRGVVHTHGMPTAERTFSLEGKPITTGEAPLKTCPECSCTCPIATRVCATCGYEFPAATCAPDPAKLTKIEQADLERAYFEETAQEARERGYRPGWVAHRFVEKFGRFPAKLWRTHYGRQGDAWAQVYGREARVA
jgi:superfamily II DNA or RNA helicase